MVEEGAQSDPLVEEGAQPLVEEVAQQPSRDPGSFGDAAGEAPEEGEPVEEPVGSGAETPTVPLEDLQRLQAEYLNYKRRVERDRELTKQNATYAALAPITEVLDTIDRARDSAELGESRSRVVSSRSPSSSSGSSRGLA